MAQVDPYAFSNAFNRRVGMLQEQRDAEQVNALRGAQIERTQGINALSRNPNATPEDYIRAGDAATGNALAQTQRQPMLDRSTELQQQGQQQDIRQRALTNVAPLAIDALSIQDPLARKSYLKNAIPVFADDFKALGSNIEQGLGQLDAMPDQQLEQMLQQVSQFAPQGRSDRPSDIEVFEYSERLNPEQRRRMLETMRSPQVKEIGGVQTIIGPGGQLIPLSSLDAETAAKLGIANAGALGKGQGERTSVAIDNGLQAADALAVTRRGIELLHSVKTGGLDAAKLRATNLFGITGADEAELSANLGKAVLSQLRATFGAAFTEREGARLSEIEASFGKSAEGNRRLLQQAEKILDRAARRGLHAARTSGDSFGAEEIEKAMQFSLSPDAPSAPRSSPQQPTRSRATTQSGPAPGAVEDGYRFKGGNPADPNSWERI